ncbi:MAG TPA: L-threonylcarbamoyladenylate synthase [Gaiellaceae bacterium]|nr:L-threonylcarbamoyladenylate synthase [Gaiellaceae bacterium]
MTDVDDAVAAIESGRLAIVPTDTVYGLAATPFSEDAVRRLYLAKGRVEQQPTALVVHDLERLRGCLPELTGSEERVAGALLPGPYTLVVPNPARRFAWLGGSRPETIGVRIPALTGAADDLLARVGALVATSANLPGGPDPRTLDDVPAELRAAAEAVLDGGELPGTPSTVVDLTGSEPRVLREGAVPADEALRVVASVL